MYNAKEQKLRRKLDKYGYTLHKSRRRNFDHFNLDDFGGYMITDQRTAFVVVGSRFELDLEDVEELVKEIESGEEE